MHEKKLRRVIEINLTFVYVVFLVGVSNHLIIKVHSYKTPQSLYPPRSWFKGCVKIFGGDFANSLGKALDISQVVILVFKRYFK